MLVFHLLRASTNIKRNLIISTENDIRTRGIGEKSPFLRKKSLEFEEVNLFGKDWFG